MQQIFQGTWQELLSLKQIWATVIWSEIKCTIAAIERWQIIRLSWPPKATCPLITVQISVLAGLKIELLSLVHELQQWCLEPVKTSIRQHPWLWTKSQRSNKPSTRLARNQAFQRPIKGVSRNLARLLSELSASKEAAQLQAISSQIRTPFKVCRKALPKVIHSLSMAARYNQVKALIRLSSVCSHTYSFANWTTSKTWSMWVAVTSQAQLWIQGSHRITSGAPGTIHCPQKIISSRQTITKRLQEGTRLQLAGMIQVSGKSSLLTRLGLILPSTMALALSIATKAQRTHERSLSATQSCMEANHRQKRARSRLKMTVQKLSTAQSQIAASVSILWSFRIASQTLSRLCTLMRSFHKSPISIKRLRDRLTYTKSIMIKKFYMPRKIL